MKLLILAALTVFLYGCAPKEVPPETVVPETTAAETVIQETVAIEVEAQALAPAPEPALPVILECTAPGLEVSACDFAVVDYSNRADGYVMVCYTAETEKRLKVRLTNTTT